MSEIVKRWLKKYHPITKDDYTNALKEIIQEIALEGLARAKFFEKAAFYGGTCLRIVHQLNRFSEDLDFSLLDPDPSFKLEPYLNAIEVHLQSYGFDVEVIKKEKKEATSIASAFVKANTKENLIRVGFSSKERARLHVEEKLQIKLEVDIDPPLGFETEMVEMHLPTLYYMRSYTLADLFAGKMSALLARSWKGRVKGRDWYDLVWYVAKKVPLHLDHLEQRLRQIGLVDQKLSLQLFSKLYQERVENLDVEAAKKDVIPFIPHAEVLDVWSQSYFLGLLPKIHFR